MKLKTDDFTDKHCELFIIHEIDMFDKSKNQERYIIANATIQFALAILIENGFIKKELWDMACKEAQKRMTAYVKKYEDLPIC